MMTNEYDALTLVISSSYRCQENANGMLSLEETVEGQPPQIVNLKSAFKGVDGFALYRLEDRGTNLLQPFFNHNNEDREEEKKSPKYLVSMCDYMAVCSFNDNTFVFLFELKRGTPSHYQKQLDAGECFLNYIYDSIDRIKDYDGIEFDRDSIHVKKFQVKKVKSNKQTIQASPSVSGVEPYFKVETNNELRLLALLKA